MKLYVSFHCVFTYLGGHLEFNSLPGENTPVLLQVNTEEGVTFRAEFREFDRVSNLMEMAYPDTDIFQDIRSRLKHSDIQFSDITDSIYAIDYSETNPNVYSFDIKAMSHTVVFELDKWMERLAQVCNMKDKDQFELVGSNSSIQSFIALVSASSNFRRGIKCRFVYIA